MQQSIAHQILIQSYCWDLLKVANTEELWIWKVSELILTSVLREEDSRGHLGIIVAGFIISLQRLDRWTWGENVLLLLSLKHAQLHQQLRRPTYIAVVLFLWHRSLRQGLPGLSRDKGRQKTACLSCTPWKARSKFAAIWLLCPLVEHFWLPRYLTSAKVSQRRFTRQRTFLLCTVE